MAQILAATVVDDQLDTRIGLAKGPHGLGDLGEQPVAGQAYAQPCLGALTGEAGQDGVVQGHQLARLYQQFGREIGQHHAAALLLQHRFPEQVVQTLDLHGQGALRHVQRLGRAGDGAVFSHCLKRPQGGDIKIAHRSIFLMQVIKNIRFKDTTRRAIYQSRKFESNLASHRLMHFITGDERCPSRQPLRFP